MCSSDLEALAYHGTPARLLEKLVTAAQAVEVGSPTMACAAALEDHFDFAPLPERKAPRPFMLVGPPGTGKTITTAKLAARARLAGRPVGVITADTIRAGAIEQLAAFTSILEVDLRQVRGPDALGHVVKDMMTVNDLVFIDSPGLNPFSHHDVDYLKRLVNAADVEPILAGAGHPPAQPADVDPPAGAGLRLDSRRRPGAHHRASRARPVRRQPSEPHGHPGDSGSAAAIRALPRGDGDEIGRAHV